MHPINSTIITNPEFAYYVKLCNGDTEDVQREGLQSIIRQMCAEGRLLLNGHIDYLKSKLPTWIRSSSRKVRMWSLWLASLINDDQIEAVSLEAVKGEKDPQFIAPVLSIIASRHGKQEYRKISSMLENKYLQAELNEDILNISSALYSRDPFFQMS